MALTDITPITWSDGQDAINLNTDFETDISSWSAVNSATIAQSSSFSHSGSFALSFHGDGATADPGASCESEAIAEGQSYTGSAWIYDGLAWASGVGIQINWFDSSFAFISDSFDSIGSLSASTWTQVTVTGTAPSNAVYANLQVMALGTPASGSIFYIDEAELVGVSPLNDINFNTEVRDSYLLLLNPPACGLQRTTNLTLSNQTWTAVGFDTLLYDTLSDDTSPMFDSGSNTKITCRVDGWYECIASGQMTTPSAATQFTAALRINGTDYYFGDSQNTGSASQTLNVSVGNLLSMSSGDYIESVYYQISGASQTLNTTGAAPIFSIIRRRGL